jgi:hypothetical protein
MKLSRLVWMTAVVVGLGVGTAFAQGEDGPPPGGGEGGPGGHHHRPPPSPLVEALDANHDGVIDSNEVANASAALLTLDKNHDGKLTADEYRPPRPNGPPPGEQSGGPQGNSQGGPGANQQGGPGGHRHPPLPILQALDANHDGVIDASEIANAPAALLTLDKNHDGQLTRDEYLPPRPNGPPPDEHGGQRPPPPPDDN